MEPQLSIDTLRESDYDAVAGLWSAARMPVLSESEIARIFAQGGRLLVARIDSECIGTVLWTFDGERAVVRKVTVREDYRRRGIAAALLESARRQMRDAGIKRAVLFTGQQNIAAQRLYSKLGWTLRTPAIEAWQITP